MTGTISEAGMRNDNEHENGISLEERWGLHVKGATSWFAHLEESFVCYPC